MRLDSEPLIFYGLSGANTTMFFENCESSISSSTAYLTLKLHHSAQLLTLYNTVCVLSSSDNVPISDFATALDQVSGGQNKLDIRNQRIFLHIIIYQVSTNRTCIWRNEYRVKSRCRSAKIFATAQIFCDGTNFRSIGKNSKLEMRVLRALYLWPAMTNASSFERGLSTFCALSNGTTIVF